MKKRKRKASAGKKFLIILLILIFIGYILFNLKPKNLINSFNNPGYLGNEMFKDVLKELDYEVHYSIMPITNYDSSGLLVINTNSIIYSLTEEDLNEIVDTADRGVHILLVEGSNAYDYGAYLRDYADHQESDGSLIKLFFQNGGVILVGDSNDLSNISLVTDNEAAYDYLKIMHPYMEEYGVTFNEFYFINQEGKVTLWSSMPSWIKYMIVQGVLVLIALFWMLGKRFGAPQLYYEEAEPEEHQYAIAVGELYLQAGHYEVLLEGYYRQLSEKIKQKTFLTESFEDDRWTKIERFMESYRQGHLKEYSKRVRNKKIKEMLIFIQNYKRTLE